ncbi:MAG: hypothetical protein J6U96_06190 [Elusimicrobiaceae bacterium]|nr:hypothetical protein [Elusimicrobiaceae bacterium]
MKKIILFLIAVFVLGAALPLAAQTADKKLPVYMRPTKEQRLEFKQRNKQIRALTKKYRKAQTAEEKAAIKAQLTQIVSDATDASMAWAIERVAAEKENLISWEQKLQERQKNLDEIKARRVDEILSGEAERRFKLSTKRWKKEMTEMQKNMK